VGDPLSYWPQIGTGIVVSVCSAIVALVVQRAAKKLEDVATKSFVRDAMGEHEVRMRQMFVDVSLQSVTNADIEFRMRRIESAVGVEILRPPILRNDQPSKLRNPE
jgi:hypothetical protein